MVANHCGGGDAFPVFETEAAGGRKATPKKPGRTAPGEGERGGPAGKGKRGRRGERVGWETEGKPGRGPMRRRRGGVGTGREGHKGGGRAGEGGRERWEARENAGGG